MKTYHDYAKDAWPGLKSQVRKRKRKHRVKQIALIAAPIILAAGALQTLSSNGEKSLQVAQVLSTTEQPAIEAQSLILTDEEALEKLADFGPIIIHLADGSKEIILTRPNNIANPNAGAL